MHTVFKRRYRGTLGDRRYDKAARRTVGSKYELIQGLRPTCAPIRLQGAYKICAPSLGGPKVNTTQLAKALTRKIQTLAAQVRIMVSVVWLVLASSGVGARQSSG